MVSDPTVQHAAGALQPPRRGESQANLRFDSLSGLNIIQEAFADCQTAVTNSQSDFTAFADMKRVLNEAMGVWGWSSSKTAANCESDGKLSPPLAPQAPPLQ